MPLALSVGILAAILTYLAVATSASCHVVVWVSFISWAAYFVAGANRQAVKCIAPLAMGTIWGLICILVMTGIFQQAFSLPILSVLVGIAALAIVLMMRFPLFALAPAQFLGFAAFFGALFGNAAGTDVAPGLVAVYVIISLAVGVLFGLVSVEIPGLLSQPETQKDSSQEG